MNLTPTQYKTLHQLHKTHQKGQLYDLEEHNTNHSQLRKLVKHKLATNLGDNLYRITLKGIATINTIPRQVTRKDILEHLHHNPYQTNIQIAAALHTNLKRVMDMTLNMHKAGQLKRHGTHYERYWTPNQDKYPHYDITPFEYRIYTLIKKTQPTTSQKIRNNLYTPERKTHKALRNLNQKQLITTTTPPTPSNYKHWITTNP